MRKNTVIKAVETVRRIRDMQSEQTRGKAPAERIAFYRAKSREMQALLQERLADMHIVDTERSN